MLAAMTRRTLFSLPLLLLSLGFAASELGAARARLRAAGKRERVPAEAAGHGEEAHGRRRPSARGGSRARHPAQRRQRGRCRHRRADGAQPGRAAILGYRRRRLYSLLGRGLKAARKHRRPRDRACRRHARALPRCRRQAAAARRGHGERAFDRRARRAGGACSSPTTNTASCLGRNCSSPPSRLPAKVFPSRPASPRCSPRPTRKASRRTRALISSMRKADLGPSATSSPTRRLPTRFETIARDGAKAFYRGDIAKDIASAVQNDPRKPGKLAAAGHRVLSRHRARADLRALSRAQGLRHGAVVLRRRCRGAGARHRRAVQSRPCAARRARHACHRRGGAARFRRPRALPRRYGFRSRAGRRAARPDLPCRTPRLDQSGPCPRERRRRIAAEREARRFRQRPLGREEAAPATSPSSTTRATPFP